MAPSNLRAGFIGLGIMGKSMALNLRKAGFPLTVYNRTAAKTAALREAGASVADSPAAVARASDLVVSCVSDSPDVLEVVLDEKRGVLAGAREGLVAVDCSTASPKVAVRCAEALAARGAAFLDAPVSGGDVGARDATLSIMVGGDTAAFDRALPVLRAMGRTVTRCGGPGAGYLVKLCNQVLGGLHLVAAAEALCLAEAAGVDLGAMLQAVSSGAAASWMLTHLAPKMVAGDDRPGFFVDYQLKDLRIAHEAAHDLGVPLPGAALTEALFRAASTQGYGRAGTQAVYHVLQRMRGPGAGASVTAPRT
jgi:3-hydroxyisobutyrate dehydrogenase